MSRRSRALLINSSAVLIADEVLGQGSGDVLGATIIAPIVEEGVKGAFVVGLLIFRRREFDGIVDGVVYAGLVAAGFAFTENILYMGRAFAEDDALVGQGGGVLAVLILRGILSPFAHPLFTSMTGIGCGLAAAQPLAGGTGAVRAGRLRVRGAAARALERLGDVGRRRRVPRVYLFIMAPLFLAMVGLVVLAAPSRAAHGRRPAAGFRDGGLDRAQRGGAVVDARGAQPVAARGAAALGQGRREGRHRVPDGGHRARVPACADEPRSGRPARLGPAQREVATCSPPRGRGRWGSRRR